MQITNWGEISGFCENKSSIYITHASYELDRSLNVTINLSNHIKPLATFILATTKTLAEDDNYKSSFHRLMDLSSKFSNTPSRPVITDRNDLVDMLRALEAHLHTIRYTEPITFFVDFSVFPKDRLWVVIDLVYRLFRNPSFCLFYTEPLSYSTEKSTSGWLSKGVSRVSPIPGFNGRQNPEKPNLMVLITGHENERMSITINNREPHKLILIGQGSQQHGDITTEIPRRILEQLMKDYGNIVDAEQSIAIGSRDAMSTKIAIEKIFTLNDCEFNISIAPFGTKAQSLGALIACLNNRKIEAVYAQPQIYHREAYSSGVGDTWLFQLDDQS